MFCYFHSLALVFLIESPSIQVILNMRTETSHGEIRDLHPLVYILQFVLKDYFVLFSLSSWSLFFKSCCQSPVRIQWQKGRFCSAFKTCARQVDVAIENPEYIVAVLLWSILRSRIAKTYSRPKRVTSDPFRLYHWCMCS